MYYTTRHWLALPGHEEEFRAGFQRLAEESAPGGGLAEVAPIASYFGQDVSRPGSIVTFAVWPDRAAAEAFIKHPVMRECVEEIRRYLDATATAPSIQMDALE